MIRHSISRLHGNGSSIPIRTLVNIVSEETGIVLGRDSSKTRSNRQADQQNEILKQLASKAKSRSTQQQEQQQQQKHQQEIVDETRGEAWRKEERNILLQEAGYLTRSLFRACLRSIKLMRPGNDHDEKEFREREEKQLRSFENSFNDDGDDHVDSSIDSIFAMMHPVNRENELRSRAEYYHAHLRDHINSDSKCLDSNPWSEQDIDVYLHFLRLGERRRRYVLKDYRFPDKYRSVFDAERVNRFAARAREFLRDSYKASGQTLPSEVKPVDLKWNE